MDSIVQLGFKLPPGWAFILRFQLNFQPIVNSAIMSTLTLQISNSVVKTCSSFHYWQEAWNQSDCCCIFSIISIHAC